MTYFLILVISNFAVFMTLGNSSLLPVCLLSNYLLIKGSLSFSKSQLRGLPKLLPHFLIGILLTVMQFSRDHDYYYNIVSDFHLKGVESNTPFTAVSLYHHFDLWCMAIMMKVASFLPFTTAHVNFYSIANLFVVSLLSYRIWKVLFKEQTLRYSLFLLVLLIVNSFLSKFTWFIDFELNGTKQSILFLFLFELITTKNENLRKLYFLTFLSCNPLICSWLTFLLCGAYILSYILRWNKEEFKRYLPIFRNLILISGIFWIFFIARAFIFKTDFPYVPGAVPYDTLLPDSIKGIPSTVLFYYRYNHSELYLRLIVFVLVILYWLIKPTQQRLSITILIYLGFDFVQAGYFGYKFFEFQQFTAIPLSVIVLFLLGDLLYAQKFSDLFKISFWRSERILKNR